MWFQVDWLTSTCRESGELVCSKEKSTHVHSEFSHCRLWLDAKCNTEAKKLSTDCENFLSHLRKVKCLYTFIYIQYMFLYSSSSFAPQAGRINSKSDVNSLIFFHQRSDWSPWNPKPKIGYLPGWRWNLCWHLQVGAVLTGWSWLSWYKCSMLAFIMMLSVLTSDKLLLFESEKKIEII